MIEFVTSIVIPCVLTLGLSYVVLHQYREQESRLKTRQDENRKYLKDKAKD